jgi:hypothetical protein
MNEVKKGAIFFFVVWSIGISGCVYVSIEKDHDLTTADNISEIDKEINSTEMANTTIGDELKKDH